MSYVYDIAIEFWHVLAEMAPYLLFGFLVAGLLSVFISARLVERHLGGPGVGSVFKASIFGIPLPLCSCGVIPVGASLRRSGASRGATTSFLISTPQTGIDSIMVTFSLLGPVFAVVRPLAALATGLVGGVLTSAVEHEEKPRPGSVGAHAAGSSSVDCGEACAVPTERPSTGSRVYEALRYGFVALPQDIGRSLLAGLAIAGLIGAFVPSDFFTGALANEWATMLIMLVAGIPVYVCATGSVPIAAALMLKGLSPGAALVFLMTGPATNAATLVTIWNVVGRRTAVVYLSVVAAGALISGAVLNALIGPQAAREAAAGGYMLPAWLQAGSAVVLLAVLLNALWQLRRQQGLGSTTSEDDMSEQRIKLSVTGMSCNHCANAVERALAEVGGVDEVEVDLGSGAAVVRGDQIDRDALTKSVQEVGYGAEIESSR
jgi:hypothetical protein